MIDKNILVNLRKVKDKYAESGEPDLQKTGENQEQMSKTECSYGHRKRGQKKWMNLGLFDSTGLKLQAAPAQVFNQTQWIKWTNICCSACHRGPNPHRGAQEQG